MPLKRFDFVFWDRIYLKQVKTCITIAKISQKSSLDRLPGFYPVNRVLVKAAKPSLSHLFCVSYDYLIESQSRYDSFPRLCR